MNNNLNSNFNAIKIKQEDNVKELNNKKDQTIDLKILRKEFSEIKSFMKKTKLTINKNGQLIENNNNNFLNKEKTKIGFSNKKRNIISGTNFLSMNLDIKKNNQENEIKNAQSKNFMEIPIDININNIQHNSDKNFSLKQNKENFNSINLNENLEEQSIGSFISKIICVIFFYRN